MKKVIILGAIIATISNNNASGMLLRYIKPTPQQRLIPQQRTICILPPDAVKPKRFKSRKDSSEYNEKQNEIVKELTEQNKSLIEQNLKLKERNKAILEQWGKSLEEIRTAIRRKYDEPYFSNRREQDDEPYFSNGRERIDWYNRSY
jgi:hypothetical protein